MLAISIAISCQSLLGPEATSVEISFAIERLALVVGARTGLAFSALLSRQVELSLQSE